MGYRLKGDYFRRAREIAESNIEKKLLRAHQIIVEGVIEEPKTLHLLNRCGYRRLEMFKIQLLITASVINLKRLMERKANRNNESAISKMVAFYHTVTAMLLFKLSKVWQKLLFRTEYIFSPVHKLGNKEVT